MSGDGPKPINPEPLSAERSADLTTVKKVNADKQWLSSLPKQALSSAGCPRI